MLRAATLLALLATVPLALSGCAGNAPVRAEELLGAPSQTMSIVGLVQDESFAPVAGAQATVRLTNRTAASDAGGLFRFDGLPLGPYVVDVTAPGFRAATLTAEPRANASLNFVLEADQGTAIVQEVFHFTGILRCALEAAIISPSCDTVVEFAGGPSVSEDIATFEQGVRPGWNTTVVDVVFDASAHPGLAGLRLTVRGHGDAAQLDAYEQYGRFYAPQSFAARLDPGATYEDGTAPIPANTTYFGFDVYPHSHGYHAACEPVTNQCPLGVGAGMDVPFDLYVTVFYGAPAPEGYSFQTTGP